MKTAVITVNNKDLSIKELDGQRVVTFKEVDEVHDRPNGTAKRNFNENKHRFIEGEDYFEITRKEFGTNFVPNESLKGNPKLLTTLLTETGYLMLVKSFTDDLAWKVQRELVKSYFNKSHNVHNTQTNNENLIPMDKIISLQQDFKNLETQILNWQQGIDKKLNRIVPLPQYSAWKDTINPKIAIISRCLQMENTKVLSMLYMEISKNNNVDLHHLQQDLSNRSMKKCTALDTIESYPQLKESFEALLDNLYDKIVKTYNVKLPKEKSVFEKSAIELAIEPLIKKYNYKSIGGTVTYRKVYSNMNVGSWAHRITRYKNKHNIKTAPSKKIIINNDEKLQKMFFTTVRDLLKENT